MNPRWTGAGLIALSAVSFGAMAIFARFAFAGGVELTAVLFLRFLIAGGVMAAVMVAGRRRWPSRRNMRVLALMGGVGYVGQSLCFFSALKHASAGLVSLLLYLYPFLVTVLGVVFLGERLTVLRVVAVIAALLGTALTIGGGLAGSSLGIAFGAATALIYSVYIVVGSRVLRAEDSLAAATVVMLSAAAVFGVICWVTEPRFPDSPTAWVAVLAIALVSTLEPVVTFVLAAVFLGEPLALPQAAGGVIVLGAVIALARGDARRN